MGSQLKAVKVLIEATRGERDAVAEGDMDGASRWRVIQLRALRELVTFDHETGRYTFKPFEDVAEAAEALFLSINAEREIFGLPTA